MSHTPGPWSYGIYSPYSESGQGKYQIRGGTKKTYGYAPLAMVRGDKRVTGGNGEHNARRIVACVNAFDGMPIEDVEELAHVAEGVKRLVILAGMFQEKAQVLEAEVTRLRLLISDLTRNEYLPGHGPEGEKA